MFNLARAYNNLGDVALQRRDWDSAVSNFEMCAGIARSIGNQDMLGWALFNLGEALARKGELDRAESACEEAMDILRRVDDQTGISGIHKNLGIIRSLKGDWKGADAAFAESARMSEAMDTPHALAEVYIEWGEALAKNRKDANAGRIKLKRALELAMSIDARELAKRARKSLEALG
jgi:tetratricopeptide (TPR) repeat protein